MNKKEVKAKMKVLGICVIIPTYNNERTLKAVVNSCLEWSSSVIVVNDGSTDSTSSILSSFTSDQIAVVQYPTNRGKGYAIRKGFAYARQQHYEYALTMDADGQHTADDISKFVEAILQHPQALIMGSRDIQAKNMPGKSTFANKFSNFWFTVQTLQKLPDTQTGYRLYPLHRMGKLWWVTSRYEAELEMLVFAAWHNVKIVPIPVNVYYPPAEERVSHFRPGMDFFRISLLNTVLCLLALVYGAPCMLVHKLLNK